MGKYRWIILIGGGAKIEDIENTMKKRLDMQVTLGPKSCRGYEKCFERFFLVNSLWTYLFR
jgi:hypothetical protein